MLKIGVYFLIAIAASLLLTPFSKKLACALGIVATENHRTIHSGTIPRMGGAAIMVSLAFSLVVLWIFEAHVIVDYSWQIVAFFAGALILFALGTVDDKLDLDNSLKLLIELTLATLAVLAGWRIEVIILPFVKPLVLGWLTYPLSVIWITGVINAFNMIDGLDGLAALIAAIAALVTAVVAYFFGNYLLFVLAVISSGSVLGFLYYNLNPATVFMGDCGTLPLGFILACITFNAAAVKPGNIVFLIPLLILAVPLTDMILAIARRLKNRTSPFSADKEHIHHLLLRSGKSQKGTVALLAGITLCSGLLALVIAFVKKGALEIL